jgi:hypothetical protein
MSNVTTIPVHCNVDPFASVVLGAPRATAHRGSVPIGTANSPARPVNKTARRVASVRRDRGSAPSSNSTRSVTRVSVESSANPTIAMMREIRPAEPIESERIRSASRLGSG